MKYAIVIPDGCADEPQASLGNRTPLQAAHKPNMDCLAQMGREKEASEAMGVVLDAAPGQEEVLYHLARMCAREGQTMTGIALLCDAIAAKPELEEKAAHDVVFADHPAYLMAIGRL